MKKDKTNMDTKPADYYRYYVRSGFNRIKTTYLEEDLLFLSEKYKWKGEGTKINPFVVTSSEGFAKDYIIHQSNLYIRFEACKFGITWLKESQNIDFSNNSFRRLILEKVSGLRFFECDIHFFILSYSLDNFFMECNIGSSYSIKSNKNSFFNCILPQDFKKKLKKGTFPPFLKRFSTYTLIFGIIVLGIIASSNFSFTFESALALILSGIGFVICLLAVILGFLWRVPHTNSITTTEE